MNSQSVLSEITAFCAAHPDLNFWEAQLRWMQKKYDAGFTHLLVEKDGSYYDTHNWTGEDNPLLLFKDKH